ncbi:hypothetical protein C5472_22395 [Photorhabdus sp. RW14-46]|nr:hypothetical protein [Photorhabdus sp. RW14-46]
MRVGRYTGAGFLIVLLLLSAYAYANPLAVAAVRVLPRLFSSVVAKRAANDAVYLSTVKAVNNVAAKEIVKNAGRSSLFKDAVGAASWILLGYNVVDAFSLNDDSVIMNSADESRLTEHIKYSFERNKYLENQLTCIVEDYCEISALSNIRFTKKDSSTFIGEGDYTVYYKPDKETKNRTYKIGINLSDINAFYKYLNKYSSFPEIRSDVDYDKFYDEAKDVNVSPDFLAKFLNNMMLKASLLPDYEGVPVTSSNPVTAAEINAALGSNTVSLQDLLNGIQISPELKPEVLTQTNPLTNPKPEPDKPSPDTPSVSLGENPGIPAPSLDDVPSGDEILNPLKNLMPEVKNMSISSKDVRCPVWSFELWDNKYSIDSHCELLEKIRSLLKAVFLLIWGIISLRIILTA